MGKCGGKHANKEEERERERERARERETERDRVRKRMRVGDSERTREKKWIVKVRESKGEVGDGEIEGGEEGRERDSERGS